MNYPLPKATTMNTSASPRTSLTNTSTKKSSVSSPRAKSQDRPRHSPPRVAYGPGAISRLPAELGFLRVTSPLIVSSPSRVPLARRIQSLIPNLNSHILDSAVINVPNQVVDDTVGRISGRDAVISVGGSSAVGLARAISVRKGIPHICIPTTYSGFEVMPMFEEDAIRLAEGRGHTNNAARRSNSGSINRDKQSSSGRTKSGSKTNSKRSITMRDASLRIKPAVIIYDEELTALSTKRIAVPDDSGMTSPQSVSHSRRYSEEDISTWGFLDL